VCCVHVWSGCCNKCNCLNSKTCNIRISSNKWSTIREEKERLQARLYEIQKEELEIKKALAENANCAAEAIAVKEIEIQRIKQ
jgi:hypothetical protein